MSELFETITTKNGEYVHNTTLHQVEHITRQDRHRESLHNALVLYVNTGASRRLNQVIGHNGFTIDVIQDRGFGGVGKIIQAETDIETTGLIEIRIAPCNTAVRRIAKVIGLAQEAEPEYLAARVSGSRGDHAFMRGDVAGRRKHRITSALVAAPKGFRR